MRLGPWFWLHMFFMWFTLAFSGFSILAGESPPPLLLLVGMIQALIVHREWESSAREEPEGEDVP